MASHQFTALRMGRNKRGNAEGSATTHHKGARRSQKVFFRPGPQVLFGCKMSVHAFQVGRNQVTGDVSAAPRAFDAVASGAAEAELGARGIDEGQGLHGCVLWGDGKGIANF